MNLQKYRQEIDAIDQQLVQLFCRRMAVAEQVAAYKIDHDLPVFDGKREREKLETLGQMVPADLQDSLASLYATIFHLSRNHQQKLMEAQK